jgi:type I restriction enzyme S subunit
MIFKIKKLGEICKFQGGSQPPKSNFIYEPKKGYIRFLQIRDFGSEKNHTYIPENKKNKICNSEDIMIGRYGASVGRILRGRGGAYNVALMKAIPLNSLVNKEFLWNYFKSSLFQNDLRKVPSRSAQAGFSKDDIFDFQVPLPPLSIQQKIVDKLNVIFSEIDKATAAAETNAKNAEALFQSYLTKVYEYELEVYEEKTIENLTLKTKNVSPEKSPDKEFVYVDVSSISNESFKIISTQKILGKNAPSRAKKNILENDVLFATVRPTLKRIALVPNNLSNQVASTGYVVLRSSKEIFPKFIFFYLFSNGFMEKMRKLQKGASYPAVTDSDVKSQRLKVPPLSIQKDILRKIESLFEQHSLISKLNQLRIEELTLLKNSILKKAFDGELVKAA